MHKSKASFGLEATYKVETGQTNVCNNNPASRQNYKLGELMRTFSAFCDSLFQRLLYPFTRFQKGLRD